MKEADTVVSAHRQFISNCVDSMRNQCPLPRLASRNVVIEVQIESGLAQRLVFGEDQLPGFVLVAGFKAGTLPCLGVHAMVFETAVTPSEESISLFRTRVPKRL